MIDQEICAAMCTIPFEDWVRTALHYSCDIVNRLIEKAFIIRNQLSQSFERLDSSKDLYNRVEDVSLNTISHVIH